jgi:glucoamylase
MARLLDSHSASGHPGISPRWTRSDKDGVGSAYSDLSRIWFTVSKGILNEIYFPTVDRPQIRDLQYIVTDGTSFCLTERQMNNSHEWIAPHSLGMRIVNDDPEGRFKIVKEIISDPHQDCLLVHTRFEPRDDLRGTLRLYALLAPHLNVNGCGNFGNVVQTDWGDYLAAHRDRTWAVLAASVPFARCSCGYVGETDGWQELSRNFKLDSTYDSAPDGNIALTGEIDLSRGYEFVLSLAFGESLHQSLVVSAQALGTPFDHHRERFIQQWKASCRHLQPETEQSACDGGCLFRISHSILVAHEDKTYDGALIASLSIPWGEAQGDESDGGYHFVWTRDMCQSATGLLAAGEKDCPLRALIYLACTQNPDGGFYQNFWIDGEPHWRGIQLDEVAFPVILAWRLRQADGLQAFDPYPMVLKAAGYLIEQGPVSPQERWEENSGHSPSTLAAHISALVCAATFARARNEESTALYFEEYADFLEAHLEQWTVTTQGTLLSGVPRHYIRIHPADWQDPAPNEDADSGELELRNQPPGQRTSYPAKDIVDPGFLELVRYGIRPPGDALVEDSLRVVDAVLKVDLPQGSCWRRYNHDGYGQCENGNPYMGWGYGHAWPVLTGERGHYELSAGRDPAPYIRAMEGFATNTQLLPEQVWSLPDAPHAHMYFGRPTGGAMPLAWAHAEYIQLVRSAADGEVFGRISAVAERYGQRPPGNRKPFEIWKFNRQVRTMRAGGTLRIQAAQPFQLRWSADEWQHNRDLHSASIATGHAFADISVPADQRAPLRFTFYWKEQQRWEGKDFEVRIEN